MRLELRVVVCCICASLWLSRDIARAQSGSGNKAAAEALFDDGRKLMAGGEFAQACEKFEASQALDPGVGTSLNLADCYEKLGRTASAWAQFRETASAARRAGSQERERIAREHIEHLEPKLSYLTIVTWKGQEVVVTRDGQAVDAATSGTPIPVDPGVHAISAAASGKRAWTTQVTVGDNADRVSVSVPILADEPPANSAPEAAPVAPPPLAAGDAARHSEDSSGSTQRLVAIVAAGVGVVGIATGAVFGIMAASKWSDAKAACNPYPYCGVQGKKLSDQAQESGTIATVGFIVGGAGLVAGAVLWFTAPETKHEARVALGVGPLSIDLHGRF